MENEKHSLASALSFIKSTEHKGSQLGLSRIRELMGLLNKPEKSLSVIHVAGTNGKGSFCAMLASVLERAGYKTGLYTSPHLVDIKERFAINGAYISEKKLCDVAKQVETAVLKMHDKPTQFELLTAMAFLYFKDEGCELVVLEVGLGGRLDATNVIEKPLLSVIMNLGIDHTDYLGDSIEVIAREKAGIIKHRCPVLCYDSGVAPMQTIKSVCNERGAKLHIADFSKIKERKESLLSQNFMFGGLSVEIPLLGEHQSKNASLVIEATELLRARGLNISDESLSEGLKNAKHRARLEILGTDPLFIIDGAHNPQCVTALTERLPTLLNGKKATFIVGFLKNKDYFEMLRQVLPFANEFLCLTPNSPLSLDAETLASQIEDSLKLKARAFKTAERAVKEGLLKNRPLVAMGSLYMAGDILAYINAQGENANI